MPTYSPNYQFKLIGTGEEAGSWGESANENLKKVEASVGRSVFIDITASSLPSGSSWTGGASATDGGIFEWITGDSTLTSESGSEGRSAFVVFTDTTREQLSGATVIQIRGGSTGVLPDRNFIIRNGLGSRDIDIDLDGADYTLRNGMTALISTTAASMGFGYGANNVFNSLGSVQLDGVDFRDQNSASIHVTDSQAAALSITDGTTNHLVVDTSADKLLVGTSAASGTILSAGSQKLVLGTSAGNMDVEVTPNGSGNLHLTTGAFEGNVDVSGDTLTLADDQIKAPKIDKKADSGIVMDGDELSLDLSATGIAGTLVVEDGGTGAATFTDGAVLIGNGTSPIQAVALADTKILVGQSGDPVGKAVTGVITMDNMGVTSFGTIGAFAATSLTADDPVDAFFYFKRGGTIEARIFTAGTDRLYVESGAGLTTSVAGARLVIDEGDQKLYAETSAGTGTIVTESLTPGYDRGLKAELSQSVPSMQFDGTDRSGSNSVPFKSIDIALSSVQAGVFEITPHGGSGAPVSVTQYMECLVSEFNYSVGDRTPNYNQINYRDGSGGQNFGMGVGWDATNVWLLGASDDSGRPRIFDKSSGSSDFSTNLGTNWKIVLNCWW